MSKLIKEDIELKNGLVLCTSCDKVVPDSMLCVYCGVRLKGEYVMPPLKDSEREVLTELMASEKELTVPDIHTRTNRNKGSIRVILTVMTRLGLVDKPSRGLYKITELGESMLKKPKIIKIEVRSDTTRITVLGNLQILRIGTMARLFKRAGNARMSRDGYITLALVLERFGEEIAIEAIAIAKDDNNRMTIRVGDMEQAIKTVVPKTLKEVK